MCLRNIWMVPKAKMTDENDEETEEICDQGRTYVTRICEGKPSFDDGKYHNHCHQCPGFGMCIGDYRYLTLVFRYRISSCSFFHLVICQK